MTNFHRASFERGEVVVLSDGTSAFPAPFLMVGVPEAEQDAACKSWGLDPAAVESHMNCVYVELGGNKLLFDTGAGPTFPGCGEIFSSLERAGIDPGSIDQVIHTHLHLDHVGNNVDAEGEPRFPNARYCLGQSEWDFWSSEETLEALERGQLWKLPDFEPLMAATAKANVLAIEDRVDVFPDDGEPAPGVTAIPAFGHTPGHLAFKVDLGSETLMITGDLVLSPFHIDQKSWYPAVDLEPDSAVLSRARVFDMAAEERYLVSGYHLPFPGIGRVEKATDGWTWTSEF
jgi:glyoxylase-like metal-dependent hydrolase (beta-lactamase superfamily II)